MEDDSLLFANFILTTMLFCCVPLFIIDHKEYTSKKQILTVILVNNVIWECIIIGFLFITGSLSADGTPVFFWSPLCYFIAKKKYMPKPLKNTEVPSIDEHGNKYAIQRGENYHAHVENIHLFKKHKKAKKDDAVNSPVLSTEIYEHPKQKKKFPEFAIIAMLIASLCSTYYFVSQLRQVQNQYSSLLEENNCLKNEKSSLEKQYKELFDDYQRANLQAKVFAPSDRDTAESAVNLKTLSLDNINSMQKKYEEEEKLLPQKKEK